MMSYLDWLHCYSLHIGAFQQPRTFHLGCSLNLGSDHKSSRFRKWGVFIFSSSCDTKSLCYTIILRFLLKYIFKKILPNFLLVYNMMLVSGIFNVEMTLSLYKSLSGLWIFCHCIPEAAWSQRSRVWVVSPSAVVDPRFSLLMQSVGKRK